MTDDCKTVFANTVRRGYLEGYTMQEFAFQQVLKMLEEASEMALTLERVLPQDLLDAVWGLHALARRYFDARYGQGVTLTHAMLEEALAEASDVVVTLCNFAHSASGGTFPLIERAIAKSVADIERGVRNAFAQTEDGGALNG